MTENAVSRGPHTLFDRLPWLIGLAISLAGCVTTQRVLRERGEGQVRCYRGSFEEVWTAAERGVRWVGLVTEVADTTQGQLIARSYEPEVQDPERMAVDADAGERVGVFLERAGSGVWAVEVVSRRIFTLDISARDWTPEVFSAIEAQLPDSARADTPEIARCEAQRRRPPSPSPGDQPPGSASGDSDRHGVASNSKRSMAPGGLAVTRVTARAVPPTASTRKALVRLRFTPPPPSRCLPSRHGIGRATLESALRIDAGAWRERAPPA